MSPNDLTTITACLLLVASSVAACRPKPCKKDNPTYPVDFPEKPPGKVKEYCKGQKRQRNFDIFGWREFVALSRLVGEDDEPKSMWWQKNYMGPSAVFLPEGRIPKWDPGNGIDDFQLSKGGEVGAAFLDATHFPVVDRDGNFVVFNIGINEKMFDYIDKHGLYSRDGQRKKKCSGEEPVIDFPPGSIEVKAAWRVFPKSGPATREEKDRFYRYETTLEIPGSARVDVELGLIGFHIAQKTKEQDQWVWATFEHVDNLVAPPGGRSTFITPTQSALVNMPPIPQGAESNDESSVLKPYTQPYIWDPAATDGYAALNQPAPNTGIPTIVHRSVPIQSERDSPGLNQAYQNQMTGPLANYQLISVQWPEEPSSRKCGDQYTSQIEFTNALGKPRPETLANIPIEVYNQTERHGLAASSCIGCHRNAFTTNGDYADFSYLLQFAK